MYNNSISYQYLDMFTFKKIDKSKFYITDEYDFCMIFCVNETQVSAT